MDLRGGGGKTGGAGIPGDVARHDTERVRRRSATQSGGDAHQIDSAPLLEPPGYSHGVETSHAYKRGSSHLALPGFQETQPSYSGHTHDTPRRGSPPIAFTPMFPLAAPRRFRVIGGERKLQRPTRELLTVRGRVRGVLGSRGQYEADVCRRGGHGRRHGGPRSGSAAGGGR
ncbi:hypothetical protein GCM10010277_19680 [Streptomyces longisporoflavus]|nr:hypothetical protein GCM10010277_19680 [Streptomyces longisporoflavus]